MPKSSNSTQSNNANQTRSEKQKILSPISHRPQPEQGENATSALQNAGIHSAFLSGRAATDFLSAYGGHAKFLTRVYEIGLGIDELDTARRNYIKCSAEIAQHLQELGQHLPRGPFLDDIRRKIKAVDSLRDNSSEEHNPQTPNRPLSNLERPRRDAATPPSPTLVGSPKPPAMDGNRRSITPKPTPTPNRQANPLRGQSAEDARRRHNPCRLCHRMGHLQTQCTLYWCYYCDTIAPGHFAKYCSRNPHQGVDRRYLPPGTLDVVNPASLISSNTTIGTTVPNSHTKIPATPHSVSNPNTRTLPSHNPTSKSNTTKLQTGTVSTPTTYTPPTISIATGPTYRPVFVVRKPKSSNHNKDLGKLQQLPTATTNPSAGRNPPNDRPTSRQSERPRSPTPYDGDNEFEYDDVALYNMTGEGHVEGMEAY